ncbi:MAG: hypothetical protein AAF703_11070 [Cyanobacteria bacterium P01_D01_bin.105]
MLSSIYVEQHYLLDGASVSLCLPEVLCLSAAELSAKGGGSNRFSAVLFYR